MSLSGITSYSYKTMSHFILAKTPYYCIVWDICVSLSENDPQLHKAYPSYTDLYIIHREWLVTRGVEETEASQGAYGPSGSVCAGERSLISKAHSRPRGNHRTECYSESSTALHKILYCCLHRCSENRADYQIDPIQFCT